jgi:hypothetical protein
VCVCVCEVLFVLYNILSLPAFLTTANVLRCVCIVCCVPITGLRVWDGAGSSQFLCNCLSLSLAFIEFLPVCVCNV